jgi:hypothetical protein
MNSAIQLGYDWKPLPKYFDQDRAQIQRTMGGPGSTRQRLEALSGQFAELSEHRQWWLLSAELWLYAQRDPDARARLAALERKVRAIIADTLQREAARSGHPLPAPPDEVAAAVLALWRGLLQQRLLDPVAVSATTFATTVSWMLQGAAAAHRQ